MRAGCIFKFIYTFLWRLFEKMDLCVKFNFHDAYAVPHTPFETRENSILEKL